MKFTTPNIVVANPIPDETKIYYSKTEATIKLVLLCIGLIAGIYLMATNIFEIDVILFSGLGVGCVFACFFIFIQLKVLNSNTPQIILNKKGIQTAFKPFYPWQQIKEIDVDSMWSGGGGKNYYLVYKTPENEKVEVMINDLNIDEKDFKNLLRFYSLYEIK